VKYRELGGRVETVRAGLTPIALEGACQDLMRQGEDVGGGVNALRLVRHLLDSPQLTDVEAVWAYDRMKPTFRQAFEQVPSLYYFEGD
jgi:hypothetical protein